MDKNVFISRIAINNTPRDNTQTMTIFYYDKDGKEDKFVSCVMKENDMAKYKKGVYKVINCVNETQLMYNPVLVDCTRVCDNESDITVGLNTKYGFIGKSNVDIYKLKK